MFEKNKTRLVKIGFVISNVNPTKSYNYLFFYK